MKYPLISVIIPFYNVEKYLECCLESVVKQTYSNLQIILVNDGSNDQSSEIAEKFKRQDKRIEVIHQINLGVAGARNTGMKHVEGQFLTFVDGDDWISANHIESLIFSLLDNNSDISVSGISQYHEDMTFKSEHRFLRSGIVWEQPRIIAEIIMDQVLTSHLPNKMFKTELWEGINFIEGAVFEDLRILPKVMVRAKRLSHTGKSTMHYRQHDTSITHTYSHKNLFDFFLAEEERLNFLKHCTIINTDKVLRKLKVYPQKSLIKTYTKLIKLRCPDDQRKYMDTVLKKNNIKVSSCIFLQMLSLSLVKRGLEYQIRR